MRQFVERGHLALQENNGLINNDQKVFFCYNRLMKASFQEGLISAITQALTSLNIEVKDAAKDILIERPAEMSHGDFSTNIALSYAKNLKLNPKSLAIQIVAALKGHTESKNEESGIS